MQFLSLSKIATFLQGCSELRLETFDSYVTLQLLFLNIEVCQRTQYLSFMENQQATENSL